MSLLRLPRAACLLALAALSPAPATAAEDDFALAFPIEAPAGERLFALELPPAAYATLVTSDLRDLAVLDAEGRAMPIHLHRPPAPSGGPMQPIDLPLPLHLALPASGSTARLGLNLRRDASGRLEALDLRDASGVDAAPGTEWLLDTAPANDDGYAGLRVLPADAEADVRLHVEVQGSDDLVHWTRVAGALPLLRVSDGDRRIERLDLRFPRSTWRYLAIRSASPNEALPRLSGLQALRDPAPVGTATRWLRLAPTSVSADGREHEFASPGPIPVHAIDVELPELAGANGFRVERRRDGQWQPVAGGTAWRLDVDAAVLRQDPILHAGPGSGPWRVVFDQPVQAPRLALGHRPDRVLVMAAGKPPYRLLAGSASFRNRPVPLDEALAAVRERRGEHWTPALAGVGDARMLAGAEALETPVDTGRWGLWLVLGAGALLVAGAAWRLLRASSTAADQGGAH